MKKIIESITNEKKRIGEFICSLRKNKAIKQVNLASDLNVSQAQLSRIECGEANITKPQQAKLAEILNVEPSLLNLERLKNMSESEAIQLILNKIVQIERDIEVIKKQKR